MPRSWITRVFVLAALTALSWQVGVRFAAAEDWPMLGRDGTRNPVSTERGAPIAWNIETQENGKVVPAQGIRWSAPLGSQTHSSPVVSGGLVWIGTNNYPPDDKARNEFHSALKCFRAADGQQVYEYVSPQLGDRVHDPGWTGLGSSPLIEGDRLWLTTNRGEVLCLDIGPLLRNEGPPRELWKLDLVKKFHVFLHAPLMGPPRNCSIGPSWKDRIFVTIGNGVDQGRSRIPEPDAPSLVCLNKDTGEVHWKDNSPGANILLTQFASPTVADIDGRVHVIVPQSDGWVRAFDPETGKLLWEFDINPKASVYSLGRSNRNSLLASAVIYESRVYVASGLDAEQGEGIGRLVCIDPTKRGDVSSELAVDAHDQPLPRRRLQAVNPKVGEKAIPNPNSALVWEFCNCGTKFEDVMHRTLNSVAIANGLVIAADFSGLVHCLDAKTGQRYWRHDTFAAIWTAPLIVRDRIFVTDEDGEVAIFGLSAEPELALQPLKSGSDPLQEISMGNPIYASPIFANGTLYVATRNELFAISGVEPEAAAEKAGGHWPQWRGANRDNVSTETGLLPAWPPQGPPLKWQVQGLGNGISPVSVTGGRVFALSDFDETDFVRALDGRNGQLTWTAAVGASFRQSPLMRWNTMRPPTVDGERLYAVSLRGELVCLRAADGAELWRKHYVNELGGKHASFGFSDCPVVDGELLICTPGGGDGSIVALDKTTGAVCWKCSIPDAGKAPYGNGVVATIAEQRQFVTPIEQAVVGVAVEDGRVLWRYPARADQTRTPLVHGDIITLLSYQTGISRIEIQRDLDGFQIHEQYSQPSSRSIGRFQDDGVLHKERLYEGAYGVFSCFDAKNGGLLWQQRMGPTFTMTFADGLFYCHDDAGSVRLIDPAPAARAKSEFQLSDHKNAQGTTPPVVADGRLYIREDDRLFCFDVSAAADGALTTEPLQVVLPPPAANLGAEQKERTLRSVFVPTPKDIVEKMLELAEPKETDTVYDLGSGDGRIVITAAKKYGCRAVGYEIDKDLVESSRAMTQQAGVEQLVTFEHSDLFTADLSQADVIAVYLLPAQLEKLLPQLAKAKPGTRLVSHQFEIPGAAPQKSLRIRSDEDGETHTLHFWTLPLQK